MVKFLIPCCKIYFGGCLEIINLIELEALAEKKLTKSAFDYYASGSDDEITLRQNRTSFEEISIYYHVLAGVASPKTETKVLGFPIPFPLILAPTAFQKMACPEGELATAKAASRAGTIMTLSTLSNTDVEEVALATNQPLFFQLYVYKDREATTGLVRRAEAAGCKALVLTVDAPLFGRREKDIRNRFTLPEGLYIKNLLSKGYGEIYKQSAESGLAAYFAMLSDAELSWKDISWLRSITKLPLVIKGIVRSDDALRARDCGANAIVVSNHGGRQLDTSPATIDALPAIAKALNGSLEIWMDGGVRRGTDIIKALALGATAVQIGRPILWGLALGGEDGAYSVIEALKREFELAMILAGCPDIASIHHDLVHQKK